MVLTINRQQSEYHHRPDLDTVQATNRRLCIHRDVSTMKTADIEYGEPLPLPECGGSNLVRGKLMPEETRTTPKTIHLRPPNYHISAAKSLE